MNFFRCPLLFAALALTAAVTPTGGPSSAPVFAAVPATAAAAPAAPLQSTLGGPSALYTPHACMDGPKQEVTRAVVFKVSAALSILGSGYILALVWGKWRNDRNSLDPYQRILAAYSAYDILLSFFYFFLGSWMTPAATGWWGAAGNTATCSVQGFFFVFAGLGGILYQMFLSLQMMLLVSYDWRPRDFERRIEYRMHGCILVLVGILAVLNLIFRSYNPSCGLCGTRPLPQWCGNWLYGDGTTECLRGSDTLANMDVAIMFLSLLVCTGFCTGAMISIYISVYKLEQTNATHSYGNEENHAKSKSIRKRMLLYTSTFYICWVFPVIFNYIPNAPSALKVVGTALAPLMGFLNMLVFFLPKCGKYQRQHVGTWLPAAYFHVLVVAPLAKTMFAEGAWWRTSARQETEGRAPSRTRA